MLLDIARVVSGLAIIGCGIVGLIFLDRICRYTQDKCKKVMEQWRKQRLYKTLVNIYYWIGVWVTVLFIIIVANTLLWATIHIAYRIGFLIF